MVQRRPSGFGILYESTISAIPTIISREDEWFYVLSGEISAVIDGKQTVVREGGSVFAPRGTAHAFQNFGNEPVQMLTMITPGGFVGFFEELASMNKVLSAPDPVRAEELRKEYRIEVLGPPLAHFKTG